MPKKKTPEGQKIKYLKGFTWLCIVSSLPKIRGGLVFKIWTKWGVIKKIFRNRGLVERGVSKLFHQFSFRIVCFHYC